MELPPDFLVYVAIGFVAQMVDGALGMAFGVISSSLLLGMGIPPAVSSATVHAAECFTAGTSALSNRAFGNIDRRLFRCLLLPGYRAPSSAPTCWSTFPATRSSPGSPATRCWSAA